MKACSYSISLVIEHVGYQEDDTQVRQVIERVQVAALQPAHTVQDEHAALGAFKSAMRVLDHHGYPYSGTSARMGGVTWIDTRNAMSRRDSSDILHHE